MSPLGPVAVNTMAPDEGNMYLIGRIGTPAHKARFLAPMVAGEARSAFFMTEPAADGGAGSDPSMMKTTCRPEGAHWIIDGRKTFITGADGAKVGIIMAKSAAGACMFLVDLPNPAVRIERVLDTIDSSMPGGHAVVAIENLLVPADQMLGKNGDGFRNAQVRLSPARLSHCMRWLGAATRAQEIASDYACRREAFGRKLIDHEGVGFMFAENLIDLRQAELMIDWCADVLDGGSLGVMESSMTKVAVSEGVMRVADRCVQVMGVSGVSGDNVVEQIFREIRAFRIYDGPTEVLVNGPAAGAGFSLAIAGDIAIAARTAHFTAGYGGLGLTPDGGMTWLLPRLVGLRGAQEIILTNRRVSAEEAVSIGLISRSVDDDRLQEAGFETARMLARAATGAIGAARGLLLQSFSNRLETQMELEARALTQAGRSVDGQEGLVAFIERREPIFGESL